MRKLFEFFFFFTKNFDSRVNKARKNFYFIINIQKSSYYSINKYIQHSVIVK